MKDQEYEISGVGTHGGTEGNDLRELKELVEFLKANGIAEFEMERPDLKVGLRFAGEAPVVAPGIDPAQMAALLAARRVAAWRRR